MRVLTIICVVFPILVFGQKKDLKTYFSLLEKENQAMGSVAFYQDGKPYYAQSFGFADVENVIKNNRQTKFRIGSISKMFTAVLILQLVEEEKLSLETTLDKYFAEIPNASKITIDMMLSHQTGLYNFTDDPIFVSYMEKPQSKKSMLEKMAQDPAVFEPGSQTAYSNPNFLLLGYIIEDIEQQSYSEVLSKRIVAPLGLKNTSYGGEINGSQNQAYSYAYVSAWQKGTESHMSIPGGAGALVSTPDDLCQFIVALFDGKLLKNESLELMKTLQNDFGRGIFQYPFMDKFAYGHTGGIDFFNAHLVYFPKEKLAMAYCGNGKNWSMLEVMMGGLTIYFKEPYEMPDFNAKSFDENEMGSILGNYANEQLGMSIKIFTSNKALMAQATGQSAFPLKHNEGLKFSFATAGIVMIFSDEKPVAQSFILKQGGESYVFKRQ